MGRLVQSRTAQPRWRYHIHESVPEEYVTRRPPLSKVRLTLRICPHTIECQCYIQNGVLSPNMTSSRRHSRVITPTVLMFLALQNSKSNCWPTSLIRSQNYICLLAATWMDREIIVRRQGLSKLSRTPNLSLLKEINPEYSLEINWCWSSNTLATWCNEPTHWKRPWCWERVKAKGKEGNRGWDGWMASPTQWIRIWTNCGRQWKSGKAGVL